MSADRIRVDAVSERTTIDIGPVRTVETWGHAFASAGTLLGIAAVARPLLTLPLRTGETMLRCGLGILFLVCILRLLHQGLWSLGGRERLDVTPRTFTVHATWFGVGRARSYALRDVTNIRARDRLAPSRRGKRRVLARTLAFDVEGRTVNTTMHLSEREATLLAATLRDAVDQHRREAARTYRG